MSNFPVALRFMAVLGPQSIECGDILEATGSDAVPTNDDSPERIRQGVSFVEKLHLYFAHRLQVLAR